MQPVEIMPIQDSLVLRARGSELLILAQHISELKQRKSKRDFSIYFTGEALVNRPARKLFEAWLRKDGTLWERLFHMVHEMEQTSSDSQAASDEQPVVKAKSPSLTAKSSVIEPAVEALAEKPVKKGVKKPEKVVKSSESATKSVGSKTTKPAAEKTAAKTTTKASPAKKSTTTKAAKSASKTAAKPAAKTAAKSSTATKTSKSSSSSKAAGKTAAKKR